MSSQPDRIRPHGGTLKAICALFITMPGGATYLHAADSDQAAAPAGFMRRAASETVTKLTAPFTVAAVGDIIMLQPLVRTEPAFSLLIDKLREADVGFANMESSLVDFRSFSGPVYGTLAPLEMGASLKAMGITLLNRANNHAFDGGPQALQSTGDELDRLGIVHAGIGRNLQEARAPAYLETPKGRVALVGMFSVDDSTNYGPRYDKTLATSRNGNLGGAPGVNPLRLTTYRVVSPAQLQTLKETAAATYGQRDNAAVSRSNGAVQRFRFQEQWYESGTNLGALHYEINAADLRDILASIRNGKTYADFLIATIHAHHSPRSQAVDTVARLKEGEEHDPPDFVIRLARECIDSGADMFVVHGPHVLRGVEIYKGKPIFYGISNFVFQFGLQFGTTDDIIASLNERSELQNPASQEALLTTSHFEGGELREVRLYPVDLGGTRRPISQLGIPLTPAPAEAQRILEGMQRYSHVFGTRIDIVNGVGVIRIRP